MITANIEKDTYIELIKIPSLKKFTIEVIKEYSTESRYMTATTVAEVVVSMLRKKKQVSEHAEQTFVQIIIAAALMHNIFYDGTVTSLFKAREKLIMQAQASNIPPEVIEAIFQTIELQQGEDTPVAFCKPSPNTPGELFAWAVWFVDMYLDDENLIEGAHYEKISSSN